MAMIADVFTALVAAVAGFLGHLAAHDFVEFTPKLSRSVIRRATKILPKQNRTRYREEWLADLNERTGVFAKLKHAFGCVRCARRMRQESVRDAKRKLTLRLEIAGIGTVDLDGASAQWVSEWLRWHRTMLEVRWLNNRPYHYLGFFVARLRIRKYGKPNGAKLGRFFAMFDKIEDGIGHKFWINGILVSKAPKPTLK